MQFRTSDITKRLLQTEPTIKQSYTDYLWTEFINSKNLIEYQSWNNMTREFLAACYTTSVALTDISAGVVCLAGTANISAFEPIFLGASWGGALLGLAPAAYFAYSDALAHTVTSEQIEHSRGKEQKEQYANAPSKLSNSLGKNMDEIDFDSEQEPENLLPITLDGKPIQITAHQWRVSRAHLLNDAFKIMNDYLVFIKGFEDQVNPYQYLPSIAKPAIKITYYAGLFVAGLFGSGQELKNTVTSFEEKNRRKNYETITPRSP